MLERSVGPDNAGIQGLLGQRKHFNLLPQSSEKPLDKGTSNDQICILKRYLCCDKNGLEVCPSHASRDIPAKKRQEEDPGLENIVHEWKAGSRANPKILEFRTGLLTLKQLLRARLWSESKELKYHSVEPIRTYQK